MCCAGVRVTRLLFSELFCFFNILSIKFHPHARAPAHGLVAGDIYAMEFLFFENHFKTQRNLNAIVSIWITSCVWAEWQRGSRRWGEKVKMVRTFRIVQLINAVRWYSRNLFHVFCNGCHRLRSAANFPGTEIRGDKNRGPTVFLFRFTTCSMWATRIAIIEFTGFFSFQQIIRRRV